MGRMGRMAVTDPYRNRLIRPYGHTAIRLYGHTILRALDTGVIFASSPLREGPMSSIVRVALSVAAVAFVACSEPPTPPPPPAATSAPSFAAVKTRSPQVQLVVDVSQDTTAQNETPLAVNPLNPNNWISGANDWNFNDGCAVNASFDGGKTWTPTLPNGFIPGLTFYTNDPAVAGTGSYEAAGDPYVAF